MYKENGREKPAEEKELANARGKVIECWKCGYTEVRNSLEFGEAPRCPKCYKGTLVEKLD